MLTLQAAIEQIPALKRSQTAAYQVNLACERLVAMGKFKDWLTPLSLQVYEDGSVTLPGEYETMIGATLADTAQPLRDPWYQFAPRPNRVFQPDPGFYPADLGDTFVTYRSPKNSEKLRVIVENPDDAVADFTASFRRSEDQGIRSDSFDVSGNLGDFLETLVEGPIFAVQRFTKPRTLGRVSLEALWADNTWTEIARFSPRETNIQLRKYSIPAAKSGDVVTGLCKKRFLPVEDITDELPVESIYCLRMALEALLSETEGNPEKAANYWTLARNALSDALSEHRSSAMRTVPIYCRAAAGSKLRAIR